MKVQVLGTFVTTLIIEKFGRKILLIISDLFICISMLGVAVFFLLYEQCGAACQESDNNSTTTAMMTTSTTAMMPDSSVMGSVSKSTVDSIGFLPLVSFTIMIMIMIIMMMMMMIGQPHAVHHSVLNRLRPHSMDPQC